MRAFQTALRPSRLLQMVVIVLHLVAVAACVAWFYGAMMWLGLLGLAGSFVYAWHNANLQSQQAVWQISVNRLQQAALVIGRDEMALKATLGGSSLITRHILFLQWDTGNRKIWQLVLPDMLDAESHRRLRVWARWCQPHEDVKQPSLKPY